MLGSDQRCETCCHSSPFSDAELGVGERTLRKGLWNIRYVMEGEERMPRGGSAEEIAAACVRATRGQAEGMGSGESKAWPGTEEAEPHVNHLMSARDHAICGAEFGTGVQLPCVSCLNCLRIHAMELQDRLDRDHTDPGIGVKQDLARLETVAEVTPGRNILTTAADRIEALNRLVERRTKERDDAAEARGAKRQQFSEHLAMFELAVLEENAAHTIADVTVNLGRGEKTSRRFVKAEKMLVNLRRMLIDMACGVQESEGQG